MGVRRPNTVARQPNERSVAATAPERFAADFPWVSNRPRLVLRKYPCDLAAIVRARQREHEQDAGLLRVERVGWNHSQTVIDVGADNAAVSNPTGAHEDRPAFSHGGHERLQRRFLETGETAGASARKDNALDAALDERLNDRRAGLDIRIQDLNLRQFRDAAHVEL